MPKEQRVVFTISKTKTGKMKIGMEFYPKLAKNEAAFNELPMYMKETQTAAANIGRFVMKAMVDLNKGEHDG